MSALTAVLSPDVIRPLIVAAIIGFTATLRRGFSAWRKGTQETRAQLSTIEHAMAFMGTEVQSLKTSTTTQFQDQAHYRGEVRETLRDMQGKIAAVDRELHPNGGSSLRDSLNRLESGLERNGDKITSVDEKLDAHLTDSRYQLQRLDKLAEGSGRDPE